MKNKIRKYLIYTVITLALLNRMFNAPLEVNYSKSEIAEHYDIWKQKNTGTYVYVYKEDNYPLYLSFVQNNNVIQYISYLSDMNLNSISKNLYGGQIETRLNFFKYLLIDIKHIYHLIKMMVLYQK